MTLSESQHAQENDSCVYEVSCACTQINASVHKLMQIMSTEITKSKSLRSAIRETSKDSRVRVMQIWERH